MVPGPEHPDGSVAPMPSGSSAGATGSVRSMTHPFRFGVQYSKPLEGTTWQETARRTEELGYSALFVPDHFVDQLAPIAALSVAAEATSTLNVAKGQTLANGLTLRIGAGGKVAAVFRGASSTSRIRLRCCARMP